MTLEYLNGPEEEEGIYEIPPLADVQDLAAASDDEEELGRIGNWLKRTAKKVGGAVKKVGDAAGKGIRFVNRYANPGTVLLRNGFLLAMKVNLMNVAGRLRYAYLSDDQARAMGINLSELAKVRKIKDKAETIYWQAGGRKENLKRAIIGGKGNADRKVPLSGLEGLGEVYADPEEYQIMLEGNTMGELGEPASGAAIAAASGTVAAIAAALSQIKGLFQKAPAGGGKEETALAESSYQGEASYPAYNQEYSQGPISTGRASSMNITSISPPVDMQEANQREQDKGFFAGSMAWVKANPGKSLLVAGAVAVGTYMLLKKKGQSSSPRPASLSGISRKKRKGVKKKRVRHKRKIRAITV